MLRCDNAALLPASMRCAYRLTKVSHPRRSLDSLWPKSTDHKGPEEQEVSPVRESPRRQVIEIGADPESGVDNSELK